MRAEDSGGAPNETAARFNRISAVYDGTRQPLSDEAVDRAAKILRGDCVKFILEAGVGTGRVALPLIQRGFDVVGVDIAVKMLAIARTKGVQNLVLADANCLPLRDKASDAALMAHVIHLLDNPARTFESLRRVARKEVVAFVRKRDGVTESDSGRTAFREAFRQAAAELGHSGREGAGEWWTGFKKESEFLSSFPPTELVTVEDRLVVTTVRERVSEIERRGYIHPPDMPDETFRRILRRMAESSAGDREVRIRRVEQMAIWRTPS